MPVTAYHCAYLSRQVFQILFSSFLSLIPASHCEILGSVQRQIRRMPLMDLVSDSRLIDLLECGRKEDCCRFIISVGLRQRGTIPRPLSLTCLTMCLKNLLHLAQESAPLRQLHPSTDKPHISNLRRRSRHLTACQRLYCCAIVLLEARNKDETRGSAATSRSTNQRLCPNLSKRCLLPEVALSALRERL